MPDDRVSCFVIVAESLLEPRLLDALQGCGARGWTVTAARGRGPRNRRVSEVEGGNIRVETLVSSDTAARIWSMLSTDYFPHYAVTAWNFEVVVDRGERYT